MGASRKLVSSLSVILCSLLTLVTASAHADPIRITVRFAVAGDNADPIDPDFGSETASGLFSIVTQVPLGGGIVENFDTGLGADLVTFAFANKSWTTADADVGRLGFDAHGALTGWLLAGVPAGLDGASFDVNPDISLDVSDLSFLYTTPRSAELGIFTGRMTSWEATVVPAPIPEPASLLLLGTGLVGLWAHVRVRTRPGR